MCIDNILAGVDTSASAAIAILYCLAKNQDKQEKLRAEICEILPNKNDELTVARLQSMPYLRAVIKEGIRLYPPTAGTMRSAGDDLVLSGYRIPKDTDIVLNLMMSNTDESLFPQAEKFIPERWLKDKVTKWQNALGPVTPFSYLPFGKSYYYFFTNELLINITVTGFGPRMCIGNFKLTLKSLSAETKTCCDVKLFLRQRFAELEIEILLARLVRDYRIEWHYEDLKIKSVTVNIPDGDLKFKFIEL
jgi:cytochrome P450 family 12